MAGRRKQKPKRGKTTQNAIAQAERASRCLELRKQGWALPAIAREVGYRGRGGVWAVITKQLDRMRQEHVEDVRLLELARLDEMQMRIWPAAVGLDVTSGAFSLVPDGDRIKQILAIMHRRAKLLGLDTDLIGLPVGNQLVKVPVTPVGGTMEERIKDWQQSHGLTGEPVVLEGEVVEEGTP